jgi:hypothetical protein
MDLPTSVTEPVTVTCTNPGCGRVTPFADSISIIECGPVCRDCEEAILGPRPDWWETIEPPF